MTRNLIRSGSYIRRVLIGAVIIGAACSLVPPASAQTIRFQPDPLSLGNNATGAVAIIMDNVPAAGLKGFRVHFEINPGTAVTYVDNTVVLDPNLLQIWAGGDPDNLTTNQFIHLPGSDEILWEVRSNLPGGTGGPSGTVVLGTMQFTGSSAPSGGTLDWFVLSEDPGNFTSMGTIVPGNNEQLQAYDNGEMRIGTPVYDLEIVSCQQTSPADPNKFIDGQTITLDCQVRNNGTATLSLGFTDLAVISADQVVNPATDTVIFTGTTTTSLGAGASTTITLSGNPAFTLPGLRYICAMVDDEGSVYENNEANNTLCKPVTIIDPFRNLQVTDVTAGPDVKVDPNEIHVGGLLEVGYTLDSAGNAVIRNHNNKVWLSADPNLDAGDTLLCQKPEPVSPGILAGDSRTVTYGTDVAATRVTGQKCGIPFEQTPGEYYIVVEGDSDAQIFERDPNTGTFYENDNTGYSAVHLGDLLPSKLLAANPNQITDTEANLTGPGKSPAFFVIVAVRDFGGYQFTVEWADPNLMTIENPNTDIVFSPILASTGRTQTCAYSNLDNTLGRVTLTCTTSGTGPGPDLSSANELVRINFLARHPGTGTLTIKDASAATSTGSPVQLNVISGTFILGGTFDMKIENQTVPGEVFPGTPFQVTYDICNVGYGDSTKGIKTDVIVSRDEAVDLSGGDVRVCSYTENDPILAFDCEPRSLDACQATADVRPGNYTFYIGTDPNAAVLETVPLPPRVFAVRKKGDRVSIESSTAPDGLGGSAGPVLGKDGRFAAKTIAALRSTARNLNFLAGFVRLERGREVYILRTVNYPGQQLDRPPLTRLRLHPENRSVEAGADIDGDGEEELVLLSHKKEGDYLEFRHIDYTKRKPVAGVKVAITDFFAEKIVSAAGIQFDGDPEDEVAVVTEDAGGVQKLSIFDLDVAAPPAVSDRTLVAEDASFGSSTDRVASICVMDYGLEGTEEVVTLNSDGTGVQSLKVFQAPATTAGEAVLIADDPAFGGTQERAKVLSIACTR